MAKTNFIIISLLLTFISLPQAQADPGDRASIRFPVIAHQAESEIKFFLSDLNRDLQEAGVRIKFPSHLKIDHRTTPAEVAHAAQRFREAAIKALFSLDRPTNVTLTTDYGPMLRDLTYPKWGRRSLCYTGDPQIAAQILDRFLIDDSIEEIDFNPLFYPRYQFISSKDQQEETLHRNDETYQNFKAQEDDLRAERIYPGFWEEKAPYRNEGLEGFTTLIQDTDGNWSATSKYLPYQADFIMKCHSQ